MIKGQARMYRFNDDDLLPFQCLECGRKFKSEGGFVLHGPCGPGYGSGRGQKNNKKVKSLGDLCPCGGSKRLLSSTNALEVLAIKAGAVSVCSKCDTVY